MASPPNLPSLSRTDLEALLVELLGQVAELKALVAAQRRRALQAAADQLA